MQRKPLPKPDEIRNLPADGGPEFNRLIHETSPYLLQHAHNPVDWYPWSDEATERARRENKPIFLSIGYSSCHWCHVMEHESFENEEIAEILNRDFVSVKVDREERPDLDDLYMLATQLMTGRGGWPNSVWLLPDGRPWYAGTYFPPQDRAGQIGFKTLLTRLAQLWRARRSDVEEQAQQLADSIHRHARGRVLSGTEPDPDALLNEALNTWRQSYDIRNGGFGDAPKFPPYCVLELILRHSLSHGDPALCSLATGTLNAMALGGIYDHIGGGFHRYSTDAHWLVPHFEKMLYDNALLAHVYTEAFCATGNAVYKEVAQRTLDWVLREMTGPEGAFYSALDADSEGQEGLFYVWHEKEVLAALGNNDAMLFCDAYHIRQNGNFSEEATFRKTGLNIPHLASWPTGDRAERLAQARSTLLSIRNQRIRPALDDKRITSWNGLMIEALARAGEAFAEPRFLHAAARAADFLCSSAMPNGELMRVWRADQAKVPAFLEDYAALTNGLLALHAADGNRKWLDLAEQLARQIVERFVDPTTGQLFATSKQHETLLARISDCFDSPLPSPPALAIRALARLTECGRDPAFKTAAASAFSRILPRAALHPSGCASLLGAGIALGAESAPTRVAVELRPSSSSIFPGDNVRIHLNIVTPSGWTLQPNPAGERFDVQVDGDFILNERGADYILIRLRSTRPTAEATARIAITTIACNESICLPRQTITRSLTFQLRPAE